MLRHRRRGHRTLCLGQGAELCWARSAPLRSLEVLDIFRQKTAPAFEVALRLGAACRRRRRGARGAHALQRRPRHRLPDPRRPRGPRPRRRTTCRGRRCRWRSPTSAPRATERALLERAWRRQEPAPTNCGLVASAGRRTSAAATCWSPTRSRPSARCRPSRTPASRGCCAASSARSSRSRSRAGAVSLRLEMLQVARLAPQQLGESASWSPLSAAQRSTPTAASRPRRPSDLYYTVFGLEGLIALGRRARARRRGVPRRFGTARARLRPPVPVSRAYGCFLAVARIRICGSTSPTGAILRACGGCVRRTAATPTSAACRRPDPHHGQRLAFCSGTWTRNRPRMLAPGCSIAATKEGGFFATPCGAPFPTCSRRRPRCTHSRPEGRHRHPSRSPASISSTRSGPAPAGSTATGPTMRSTASTRTTACWRWGT
jgi:hypothetical protein